MGYDYSINLSLLVDKDELTVSRFKELFGFVLGVEASASSE